MTEHVCEIKQDYPDVPWESDDFSGTVARREEVVRCRACRYFDAYETWAGGWCSEWAGETEQDGFCHLGDDGHAEEA